MPLSAIFRSLQSNRPDAYQAMKGGLGLRLWEIVANYWDLGFTSFGGPPVHFQTLRERFVDAGNGRIPWIDDQTYQELFAICQALPGPGSTKFAFCIALIHAGFIPAVLAFLIWSLPGAIGMFALALGVERIGEILPDPVYGLLSGLNASTVGIIALAAVQLAEKAITDPLTRMLVILGACAGLPYNALWYFPLLMAIGGIITIFWDLWGRAKFGRMRARFSRKNRNEQREAEESTASGAVPLETRNPARDGGLQRRVAGRGEASGATAAPAPGDLENEITPEAEATPQPQGIDTVSHAIPVKVGILIIIGFFASFIALMSVRGLDNTPLEFDLFANMYLAGTIIFGGGPVVIPLLREYVVEPGWVSSRDFLLGLAIIQAFPGPNFNFAVYLGALALNRGSSSVLGAFLGFLGIFFPGITLSIGVQSIWRVLRTKPAVVSLLRGVNATAVGLVFTAVYRLWEIGYLQGGQDGSGSLGLEPWWVVVAAVTYSSVQWWNVPPPVAIIGGAIGGIAWWGVVG
ncbi:chromate transporter-domain-containing protein [Tuber indicum]|nr:chromate transporter-domain-containing protein [Tuber indicum]